MAEQTRLSGSGRGAKTAQLLGHNKLFVKAAVKVAAFACSIDRRAIPGWIILLASLCQWSGASSGSMSRRQRPYITSINTRLGFVLTTISLVPSSMQVSLTAFPGSLVSASTYWRFSMMVQSTIALSWVP